MLVRDIILGGKTAQGVEVPLPNAVLVVAVGARGYVICGYLNIATAEKLGDCAAVVKGVRSIDELLNGKVVEVTAAARGLGIEEGMTGSLALAKML